VVQCTNSCAYDSHDADQSEATIQPLDQRRDQNATKVERGANNQVAHNHNTQDEMNAANGIQGICYGSAKGSWFSKPHCVNSFRQTVLRSFGKFRYRAGNVDAA